MADKCVFYKDNIILLIYVDDILIIGKDEGKVEAFKQSMKEGSENFIFTDGESLYCYLGVQIEKLPDGTINPPSYTRLKSAILMQKNAEV